MYIVIQENKTCLYYNDIAQACVAYIYITDYL
jgi:hypothetical protein